MAILDHLGISVEDLSRSITQFDPVMHALSFTRYDADGSVSWHREGEFELILFPAREPGTGPHRHGRVGWQHLAFACDAPAEVDRLHAIAVEVGWTAVRPPQLYPRFSERYYASFVEEDNGLRFEFMFNPPPLEPPAVVDTETSTEEDRVMPQTPTPIAAFVATTNAGDSDAFVALFAHDGSLDDWGRIARGHDGIREWDRTDNIGKQSHFELVDITEEAAGTYLAHLRVTGNGFNGTSPFRFALRDGSIESVVIVPD